MSWDGGKIVICGSFGFGGALGPGGSEHPNPDLVAGGFWDLGCLKIQVLDWGGH